MSHSTRSTNRFIIGAVIILILFVIGTAVAKRTPQANTNSTLATLNATVYRSASCGCCGQYIAYLKQKGITIEEKIMGNDDSDLGAIKQQFNVPPQLQSCHTMRIGDYTVEGHVPVEAIDKLLSEKPLVAGIALPGMPAGSPGMSGTKSGSFDVESFTSAGATELFAKL